MPASGTCERCGKQFVRQQRRTSRDAVRFCSRECAFENSTERSAGKWIHWWFKCCEICSVRFISKRQTVRLCSSPDCRREDARRKAALAFVPKVKPCPDCGSQIVSCQRYCSACSTQRERIARREAKKRIGKNHRSRARAAGVPYATVTREQIIKRYGTRCCICKKRIDTSLTSGPQMWSVDHVVPLALGGWHDLINVRPAHHECNSKKGAEYTGQLMLSVTC